MYLGNPNPVQSPVARFAAPWAPWLVPPPPPPLAPPREAIHSSAGTPSAGCSWDETDETKRFPMHLISRPATHTHTFPDLEQLNSSLPCPPALPASLLRAPRLLSPQKFQRSCTPKAPLPPALQPNVTCATLGPRRVASRLSPTRHSPRQSCRAKRASKSRRCLHSSQIGGVARLEAILRVQAGRAGGASFSIRRGLFCTHGQLSQSVKARWAVWGVHLLPLPSIGRTIPL